MTRPAVVPPGPWRQPRPSIAELDSGLVVGALDLPGQQVAAVRMVVPASLASERPGREGSTAMMARLLDEGCTGYTPEEFALALERRGIVLGAGAVEGGVSIDLDVPVRRLPEALDLLALAIGEPAFPQDQVDRILRSRLAEIDHESSSAPHRAARELSRVLWAPESRASVPPAGNAASVAALTRADLIDRHEMLGPNGASVIIAGHLAGLDVVGLVDSTLGRWMGTVSEVTPQAPMRAPGGTRVVIVNRPGSVQSELVVATTAPDRHDPRWPAMPVLAYLLGGSPTARVDAVLREEKGWTYGMRCAMRPRVRGGAFVASGSVRADVTVPALETLMGILEGAREGFSRDELAAGVDFITRATPGRWASADVVADEISSLALEGLPWDFPERTVTAMLALTTDDLAQAWRGVGTHSWSIVVVGDAEQHVEGLRELGLGPVTVLAD